jgi:hypothetical protein
MVVVFLLVLYDGDDQKKVWFIAWKKLHDDSNAICQLPLDIAFTLSMTWKSF